MFKKEYLSIFIIAGLSIAYLFFCFLVFLSRGKWTKIIRKKLVTGALLVAFTAIFTSSQVSCIPIPSCYLPPPTPEPTMEPTPMCYTPSPPPVPEYGTPAPSEKSDQ